MNKSPTPRLWLLLLLVIVSKPLSNLFLAWGMRQTPQAISLYHPLLAIRAVLEPLVLLGVALQLVWFLARMVLLGLADLSFVLPVTATGYLITTILGKVFLGEQVSLRRWIATGLIFAGTALVGSTARKKADGEERRAL